MLALGTLALFGTVILAACWDSLFYTRVGRADSPNHRCYAITLQSKRWLPTFPGQGSDGPGRVDLYDTDSGKRLDSQSVDIFNTLEPPIWTGHTVIFTKFIELDAPAYCGKSAAPSPVAPVQVPHP